jgi:peptidoglycan/LPS O-acetylase OafA/YrhL
MNQSSTDTIVEIEGLRAVAVAAVVLYHARFGVSGGYVGVDVFFVVSGFLITRLLLSEAERDGRISIARFAARRARRLLPAAALVLATVAIVTAAIDNTLRAHSTAVDITWAAVLLANVRFAALGTDYLRSTVPPSVVQHWWSLAVEEQFYVVWPIAVAILTSRRVRVRVAVVTVGLGAASLWWSIHTIDRDPVHAYFAPWSRAWELLAGALVACGWHLRTRMPWRAALGWTGLITVVATAVLYDRSTTFPGWAALAPVVGTAAIIWSIGGRGGMSTLLGLPMLRWLGARSYSLYLWHWPLVVWFTRNQATVTARLAAVAGALLLAHLTTMLVERPIRHSSVLVRSNFRSFSVGAASIVVAVSVASVVAVATRHPKVDTGYVAPTIALPVTTSTSVAPSSSAATSTTAVEEPTTTVDIAAELQTAEAARASIVAASAAHPIVPANVQPPLERQASDRPVVYDDGCLVGYGYERVPTCVYGDTTSRTTIALLGDSHVAQWFPAVLGAAIDHHWRLVVVTKMGCPGLILPVSYDVDLPYPDCTQWQPAAVARVLGEHPAIVIMGEWRAKYSEYFNGRSHYITDRRWTDAFTAVIEPLRAAGSRVLLLSDAPIARQQVDFCLASHVGDTSPCTPHTDSAIAPHENELLRAVAQRTGAVFHDTTAWFCTAAVCPPVIGNLAVYLNDNHINHTYSESLTPIMSLLLAEVLRT